MTEPGTILLLSPAAAPKSAAGAVRGAFAFGRPEAEVPSIVGLELVGRAGRDPRGQERRGADVAASAFARVVRPRTEREEGLRHFGAEPAFVPPPQPETAFLAQHINQEVMSDGLFISAVPAAVTAYRGAIEMVAADPRTSEAVNVVV